MLSKLSLDQIRVDHDFNCRGAYDITPLSVAELAKDIKEKGLLQPLVVESFPNGTYDLVAGFRRHLAVTKLGWKEVECNVLTGLTPAKRIAINLAENIQRQQLNLMQESDVVVKLYTIYGMTKPDIGKALNKRLDWINLRIDMSRLPIPVKDDIRDGKITQGHVKLMLNLSSPEAIFEYVKRIKTHTQNGKKLSPKEVKAKGRPTHMRAKRETRGIEKCIGFLLSAYGDTTIGSIALAWANGQVSDNELYDYVEADCKTAGRGFMRPLTNIESMED